MRRPSTWYTINQQQQQIGAAAAATRVQQSAAAAAAEAGVLGGFAPLPFDEVSGMSEA